MTGTTDQLDVACKSYPTTRTLSVFIEDSGIEGSRRDKVPSIMLKQGKWELHLTWDEARELCSAVSEITDIAEFG